MKLQDLKAGDLFQFKRQSHGIIYEVLRESGPSHQGDCYQAVGVFVEGRPSWIFPPRKVTQDGNPAPDVRKVDALPPHRESLESESNLPYLNAMTKEIAGALKNPHNGVRDLALAAFIGLRTIGAGEG